jgi:hypothetical protein
MDDDPTRQSNPGSGAGDAPGGPGAGQWPGMAPPPPSPSPSPYPSGWGYPAYPAYPPYQPQPPYYMPSSAPPTNSGSRWYLWLIGACVGLLVLSVVACVLVGAAVRQFARSLPTGPNMTVSTTTTQAFTVSALPSIVVDGVEGDVTVKTGSAGVVTVEITKHARDISSPAAQNDLDLITANATQNGDQITVEEQTGDSGSGSGGGGFQRYIWADFVVTVPPQANLDIHLKRGTVEVRDVRGVISAQIDAGRFMAEGVVAADGSQITVDTGEVSFDGALAPAASLSVRVASGEVMLSLPRDTATHLDAVVNTGGVAVSGWDVPVTHNGTGESASGDLGTHPGGTLSISVNVGDIGIFG